MLAAGSDNGDVGVWYLPEKSGPPAPPPLKVAPSEFRVGTDQPQATVESNAKAPHVHDLGSLMFAPDGKTLAWTDNGLPRFWVVATREEKTPDFKPAGKIRGMVFVGNGTRMAMAHDDGTVQLHDRATLQPLTSFRVRNDHHLRTVAATVDG